MNNMHYYAGCILVKREGKRARAIELVFAID